MSGLRWNEEGLIGAIVQDSASGDVLMHGWMNRDSLRMTYDKGLVTFWSRSRGEFWTKGETSGNRLRLVDVRYNCDAHELLVRVNLEGDATCHTGERSCFYRTLEPGEDWDAVSWE